MRRKNELFIEFYGWKRELFITGELEKSKELWDTVKREMNRNTGKCERTKSKKLEKLRTEKEREDGLKKELNGEDIMKSKEKRKELGLKTRVDDRQTRRTRKRVRKRNNKKSNQKRKERRKRECEQFKESMKDASRRTAEKMINVKDTTGYDFSESDFLLFGERQKFAPTPKRVDLVKIHEDFLEFSRKLRLKVYFHNRDVENGGESDHISVREQVGEDLEFEFVGPTPWKKNSEFEPHAGENETVEEFLDGVYKDLFDPKNRRYVKDNLSREEIGSLREFMGWNRDRNNPRVIRVEDKGSSFVVVWKSNYFERCD